jgi:hypothetical protein
VTVRRFDVQKLDGAIRTPEGYLEFPAARLTKTGVFSYRRADGSEQLELRLPEHVFDPASLASFNAQPLTLQHPADMVSSDTFRDVIAGIVVDPRKAADGVHVEGLVRVMDAEAVTEVEAGLRELSNAYDCEIVPLSDRKFQRADVNDGKPIVADVMQINIRGNHTALVARGRAGPTARLDSAGHQTRDDMELKEALEKIARLEAELKATKEKSTRADALDGEIAALKSQLKRFQDSESKAAVTALAGRAAKILRQDKEDEGAATARLAALGEEGVMRATLAKLAPEIKCDGWNADQLRGAFESSMAFEAKRSDSASSVAQLAAAAKTEAAHKDADAEDEHASENAFLKMHAAAAAAWRKDRT